MEELGRATRHLHAAWHVHPSPSQPTPVPASFHPFPSLCCPFFPQKLGGACTLCVNSAQTLLSLTSGALGPSLLFVLTVPRLERRPETWCLLPRDLVFVAQRPRVCSTQTRDLVFVGTTPLSLTSGALDPSSLFFQALLIHCGALILRQERGLCGKRGAYGAAGPGGRLAGICVRASS
jgi:hypothetical protein